MIEVISARDMMAFEKHTIEQLGVPSIALMETASGAVAREARSLFGIDKTVMFICGPGNNGGDGYCAARWFIHMGGKAIVVALGSPKTPDAQLNMRILENMGVKIYPHIPLSLSFDGIVDAMFGTGFKGELTGEYYAAAKFMNDSPAPVLSIDIPSGVNGSTGAAKYAVDADVTVTFQFPKLGHYLYPGKEYTGKLIVHDIGVSPLSVTEINSVVLDKKDIAALMPPRRLNTYKGDYGHVVIVAGSRGMAGAAVLAAQGALKGGAGLVTVGCCKDSVLPIVQSGAFEAMAYGLYETPEGQISADNDLLSLMQKKTVLAMGCGLSASPNTKKLVTKLREFNLPTVMDADALNVSDGLFGTRCVITPHVGEVARLTGLTTKDILNDPYNIALQFAAQRKVTVLLKGTTTIIADKDGRVTLNVTGTPAMSTGGSGDVLTGVISALMAQGLEPYDAARMGAYIHGLAGELAEKRLSTQSVTAMDIAAQLFGAFREVYSN